MGLVEGAFCCFSLVLSCCALTLSSEVPLVGWWGLKQWQAVVWISPRGAGSRPARLNGRSPGLPMQETQETGDGGF